MTLLYTRRRRDNYVHQSNSGTHHYECVECVKRQQSADRPILRQISSLI